jgi:hypothetical protein
MQSRKQLSVISDDIILAESDIELNNDDIVEDYRKLNEKCENIIKKINIRKKKKKE